MILLLSVVLLLFYGVGQPLRECSYRLKAVVTPFLFSTMNTIVIINDTCLRGIFGYQSLRKHLK